MPKSTIVTILTFSHLCDLKLRCSKRILALVLFEILVVMLSPDCSMDFDGGFWRGFDAAMSDEWNYPSHTSCFGVNSQPASLEDYAELREEYLERKRSIDAKENFTRYIDSVLSHAGESKAYEDQVVFLTQYSSGAFRDENAEGIAYVRQDLGLVVNNYQYSTSVVSHEMLHLALEEQGEVKACYFESVHENQFYTTGPYSILKRFEC